MQGFYAMGRVQDVSVLRSRAVVMFGCKGMVCICALQTLNADARSLPHISVLELLPVC